MNLNAVDNFAVVGSVKENTLSGFVSVGPLPPHSSWVYWAAAVCFNLDTFFLLPQSIT
jgi:hypothetical protein